jgi:uncharacterized protein
VHVRVENGTAFFRVRVTPRSNRDALEGEHDGALKVRLTAPPLDDRANEGLRRLIAEELGVTASAVKILSGVKARTKQVSVEGVTAAQVRALTQRTGKRPGR